MSKHMSNKSLFVKTNSSIIDDYFKIMNNKQMKNLQFPNSASESQSINKKSVYRPDKSRKRPKLHKCSTSSRSTYSSKSTEISSVLFSPGETAGKNSGNPFPNSKIALSPHDSFADSQGIHDIVNSIENPAELKVEQKYSWEDLKTWVPPSEKNRRTINECKIKYSWEIIGIASQTSQTLIEQLKNLRTSGNYPCGIKYSWEVIGMGTQASLHDLSYLMSDNDYWEGRIVIGSSGKNVTTGNSTPCYDVSNKPRFVCNTGTQCTADKGVHTDLTDCTVKYSWQNLTKAYLHSGKLS